MHLSDASTPGKSLKSARLCGFFYTITWSEAPGKDVICFGKKYINASLELTSDHTMSHLFDNKDMLKHILTYVPDAKKLSLVAQANKNLQDATEKELLHRTEGDLFAIHVSALLTSSQFTMISAGIQKFADLEAVQEKIFQTLTLQTQAPDSSNYLTFADNRGVFFFIMSKYPNNKLILANICTLLERIYILTECARSDETGDILKYAGNLLDPLVQMSDQPDTVQTVLRIFKMIMQHHENTTTMLQESGEYRDIVWVAFHILGKYGILREYDPKTEIIKICIDMVLPIYRYYKVLNNMPSPTATLLQIIPQRDLHFECQLHCCRLLEKAEIPPEHVPECFQQVARMLDKTHINMDPMRMKEYFDRHALVLSTLKNIVSTRNTMDSRFLMIATCGMNSLFHTLRLFQTKENTIDAFSPSSDARQLIVDDACCVVRIILQCNNMSSHFQKLMEIGTLELLMHTIEYQKCDPHPNRAQPALGNALEALSSFLVSARSQNPINVLPVANLTFDSLRANSVSPHLHNLPVSRFVYKLYNGCPLAHETSGLGYSKVHSTILYMMYIFLDGKPSVDMTRANVPDFSIAELLNTTNNLLLSALTGTQCMGKHQECMYVVLSMDSILSVFTAINDISLSSPIASYLHNMYKQLRTRYEQNKGQQIWST